MVSGKEFGHDVVDFAVDQLPLVIAKYPLRRQIDLVHDAGVFPIKL